MTKDALDSVDLFETVQGQCLHTSPLSHARAHFAVSFPSKQAYTLMQLRDIAAPEISTVTAA